MYSVFKLSQFHKGHFGSLENWKSEEKPVVEGICTCNKESLVSIVTVLDTQNLYSISDVKSGWFH